MQTREQIVQTLEQNVLVAVVRTPRFDQVLPVCEALFAGGITALEITLTVPRALDAIREVSAAFWDRALIGAGTVLHAESAREVIDAGARFVVSPITRVEVVDAAHQRNVPVMLGAYTPTEAQLAHEAGADFVKLFPADKLGPGYVKNLRGPLPHLRIVPTGGVDLDTVGPFLNAGCAALGVGSSLIKADLLATADWPALTALARAFVEAVHQARG